MNTFPTNAEAPDELDQLFSDFFKAQLKHPWPNAPIPAAAGAAPATEPSGLVNSRAETPRNAPAPAPQAKGRDSTARARFTLMASVALALGTCWVLSSGFEPGTRPNGMPNPTGILNEGGAQDLRILPTIQKNKAIGNDNTIIVDPKIEKPFDDKPEE